MEGNHGPQGPPPQRSYGPVPARGLYNEAAVRAVVVAREAAWKSACQKRNRQVPTAVRSIRERRPNTPRTTRTASRRTTRTAASKSPSGSSEPPPAGAAFTEQDLRQLLLLALEALPDGSAWTAWQNLAREVRRRLKIQPFASGGLG